MNFMMTLVSKSGNYNVMTLSEIPYQISRIEMATYSGNTERFNTFDIDF